MFVGREREQKLINEAIADERSKIIAIIGRRGIGKTELMLYTKKTHNQSDFIFLDLHGLKGAPMKAQLKNCRENLRSQFIFTDDFKSWSEFFNNLEKALINFRNEPSNANKKIIFNIDEFPWLHTKGSFFVQSFAAFWNKIQSFKNFYFILTGSAVAWMNKNVINTSGGLYGRVNVIINLKPFSFKETVDYLYTISRYNLEECLSYYMMTNGVARYLQRIKYQNDLEQNRAEIFKDGEHFNEFDILFTSSFDSNLFIHKKIVELFKTKHFITVEYVAQKLKLSKSAIYLALDDLLSSDLIIEHNNFAKSKGRQEKTYSLNDLFCFYYLKLSELQTDHRKAIMNGYAFEIFARKNFSLIREELGRSGVDYEVFVFENEKTQIDLLSKEKDGVFLLVECKNYSQEYELTMDYIQKLNNKAQELSNELEKKKLKNSIKTVFFTTYGTKRHRSYSFVNVSLNDIFNKYVKYRLN